MGKRSNHIHHSTTPPDGTPAPLRRGWTTGACATAAAKAAFEALLGDDFPDPVEITLPKGQVVSFALAYEGRESQSATVGIIKDAGDDPDITHGAIIICTVRRLPKGSGILFKRGEGVGLVTKPGLPIPVGEPAINPVPREMMRTEIAKSATQYATHPDAEITIRIPNGAELAQKTWNPNLGIMDGLSILGTTGIVVPFSCSAWIHSIHRGVDVARATGIDTLLAKTGATSERVGLTHYELNQENVIDMGDFAGGLLKYLRQHPVPHLIIAGGIGKMTKLACGSLDLHSSRSQVDTHWLAAQLETLGAGEALLNEVKDAASASHVLSIAPEYKYKLGQRIGLAAQDTCLHSLRGAPVKVTVLVIDRQGHILGETLKPMTAIQQGTEPSGDVS